MAKGSNSKSDEEEKLSRKHTGQIAEKMLLSKSVREPHIYLKIPANKQDIRQKQLLSTSEQVS